MSSLPKFVVSTTLTQVEWSHSSLIKGDIAAEVRRLKQEPGRDILVAGGALVRTQMQHDLVDEFRLMIAPVVLGSGKRLFEDGTDRKVLRLTDVRTFSSGRSFLRPGRNRSRMISRERNSHMSTKGVQDAAQCVSDVQWQLRGGVQVL